MLVKYIRVGAIETNCYFLIDEKTKECVIIDPGAESEKLINFVREIELDVKYILITHGHYDHIGGVERLKEALNVPVVVCDEEFEICKEPRMNFSTAVAGESKSVIPDTTVKDGDTITSGDYTLEVIKVPGHTIASICYYEPKSKVLISGDTLFKDCIGRTDLYPGRPTDLAKNIKEKLLVLPEDTKVYPGHGPSTEIGYEKINNPYLTEKGYYV